MTPRGGPDEASAVYVISVAAELSGLHPQTLRTYERMGLITPQRTGGGGRRYSARDVELLRTIAELTGSGIGIEGVRQILELQVRAERLARRNKRLEVELEATREMLRAAVESQSPTTPPSRVPALRPPPMDQSMVIWRRRR